MASLTNRGAQLQDTLLTNLSRKYTPTGFIAERVAPRIPVANEGGKFPVWERSDFFRIDTDPLVADRSETKRIGFTASTEPYQCEEYALATDISRRERNNAENLLNLRQTKVQGVQDILALHREKRVADLLTATGGLTNSSTPTNNWNVDAGTIEADIVTAKEAVFDDIGRPPNLAIIPWKVANAVAVQQDIREILKYTVNGSDILRLGEMALPRQLWGLEVLVPSGPAYTTSAEGASATYSDVWGDDVRVLYVNPSGGRDNPSTVYTLQAEAPLVSRWEENDPPGLEVVRYSDGVIDEKLVAPDAGYILLDVLS